MSIKTKLSLAFGAIIAILVLEIALNQVVSYRANRTYEKLTTEVGPVLSMLNKFQAINKELGLLVTGKVSGGLSERNQNRMKGILEVEIPYYKTEIYLLQDGLAPQDPKVALCADAVSRANTIILLCKNINRLLVTNDDHLNPSKQAEVNEIIDDQLTDELFQLHNDIEALRLMSTKEFDQFQRELSEDLSLVSWIILITGLLGVLFGCWLAILTIQGIVTPLKELNASALQVTEGNYQTRVPAKRKDELGILGRNFNKMILSLDQAKQLTEKQNKELEQFIYISSHDLQEPVRTITSLTELVMETNNDTLDDTGKKSLAFIMDSAVRMQQLIKGLLDYGRIGKENRIEKVDIAQLIKNIESDLGTLITETETRIKLDKLPIVDGYKTDLRLLFQNLITNAIKFVEGAPVIEISAKRLENAWQFSVKDNGIGIAPEHQEKIFTIFQRLHAKEAYAGTGIGLAHCMKIVQLHGGKLWVDSQLGKGSIFSFTLMDVE